MAEPAVIGIGEPGRQARRITVDRVIEMGSDCDGEIVADPSVSQRHLKLVASPVALSLVNLSSDSGTFVNGQQIEGRAVLDVGDVVRFGATEIEVVSRSGVVQVRHGRGGGRVNPVAVRAQREAEPEPPTAGPGVVTRVSEVVFLGPIPKPGEPVFRKHRKAQAAPRFRLARHPRPPRLSGEPCDRAVIELEQERISPTWQRMPRQAAGGPGLTPGSACSG